MQPTFKHVPPNSLSFSTRAVFNPSWPERMAATYPPGPEPIITTSNFSIMHSQPDPTAWRHVQKRNREIANSVTSTETKAVAQAIINGPSIPVSRRDRALNSPAIPVHQYANRPISIITCPIIDGINDCEDHARSPSNRPAPKTIGT